MPIFVPMPEEPQEEEPMHVEPPPQQQQQQPKEQVKLFIPEQPKRGIWKYSILKHLISEQRNGQKQSQRTWLLNMGSEMTILCTLNLKEKHLRRRKFLE